MPRSLVLLALWPGLGLLAGCAPLRPEIEPRVSPPISDGRIDPPVPLGVLLGPDALVQAVVPPADGPPVEGEWDTWEGHGGVATVTARFWHDGRPGVSVSLVASTAPLPERSGRAGPPVGGRASVWTNRGGRPALAVRVRPDREVLFQGDSTAAVFALVDLGGLAAATPADTAFVHPRTRALRFGRAAADAYARAARIVEGGLVLPEQLAALLPDTSGLGLPHGTTREVREEWATSDYPDADVPDADVCEVPPDLHRVDAAAVAWVSLMWPGGQRARVELADIPGTPRGREERAVSSATPQALATRPEDTRTWFARSPRWSETAFRVGEDRLVTVGGSDTTVAAALLRRVDVAALAALVPARVWRPAGSAWEVGGDRVVFAGLAEQDGRVRVLTGETRLWQPYSDSFPVHLGSRPFSFRQPDGWFAVGTAGLDCSGGGDWGSVVALLSRAPVDPCRGPGYTVPWDPHTDVARAGPAVVVDVLLPVRRTAVRWLETWPGYARSMLPPWTAAFETTRAPAVAPDGTVAFALAGPGRVVEAVYAPVGDWLVGVVGAGRPSEAVALREAVAAVARSLQPGL